MHTVKYIQVTSVDCVSDVCLFNLLSDMLLCFILCVTVCRWEGEGVNEVGKNKATGDVLVRVNPKFYRPTEVVSNFEVEPYFRTPHSPTSKLVVLL